MSKTCTNCHKSQELDQFPKHKAYKGGRTTWCRSCLRTQANGWYENNKDRAAEMNKKWEKRNPRSRASSKFKGRYGITIEVYEQMVLEQNGECAICKKNGIDNLRGKLFVDHCHTTSNIRGLLCHDCNSGIGRFKDSTDLLNEAINYLNKSVKITKT